MAPSCNPRSWESETGGSAVPGEFEFEDHLGCMKLYLKNQKQSTKNSLTVIVSKT